MATLYLVRHGQASFGEANYDALSDIGQEQAQVIGHWLHQAGVKPNYVVAGSLQRQQDTARIALETLTGLSDTALPALDTDPRLNEYDHEGIFRVGAQAAGHAAQPNPNMCRKDFQTLFEAAMKRWASGAHDAEYSETLGGFYARAEAAVKALQARPQKGETVLAFSSGGTIAMICRYALGMPLQQALMLNYMIANCTVSRFFYDDKRFSLSYFNNHGMFETLEGGRLVTFR
jgi:broad specificity phosphatase PhoE